MKPAPPTVEEFAASVQAVPPLVRHHDLGERPTPVHLTPFALASFTTGCGCIAPRACMQLQKALKRGDRNAPDALMARFMPLENLREAMPLIRVLHDAMKLCGPADMGAQLPLLSAAPGRPKPARTAARSAQVFQ